MDTIWWVVIVAVAVVAVVAIAASSYARSRRRTGLQDRFGPEYDRAVSSAKSRRKAEQELTERERTHDQLEIRPLSETSRERFVEDWRRAEQRFVDDPELAAREADMIVREVLEERGYPNDDFDAQAAAVSVDHPTVVERYRHGHRMVHGNGTGGQERTENLRKAMVDFRTVFEQLTADVEPGRAEPEGVEEPAARRT